MTKVSVTKLIGRRAWTGQDGLSAQKATRTSGDCTEVTETRMMKELDVSSMEDAAQQVKQLMLISLQPAVMHSGGVR